MAPLIMLSVKSMRFRTVLHTWRSKISVVPTSLAISEFIRTDVIDG